MSERSKLVIEEHFPVTIEERRRVTHPQGGESRTKQADAKDADIRTLVNRWKIQGLTKGNPKEPQYGDFSSGMSFHDSLNRIMDAESDFMELPAKVRRLADNDVGKFIDMLKDPDKVEEMKKLGAQDDQLWIPGTEAPEGPKSPETEVPVEREVPKDEEPA